MKTLAVTAAAVLLATAGIAFADSDHMDPNPFHAGPIVSTDNAKTASISPNVSKVILPQASKVHVRNRHVAPNPDQNSDH